MRRPAACEVAERHVRERRLADARRAAEQHERAGHEAAAQDAVELADPGQQPLDPRDLDVAQRDDPRRRAARATPRAPPEAFAGAASSTSVFHSPQPGHCPCHLASAWPQAPHTQIDFAIRTETRRSAGRPAPARRRRAGRPCPRCRSEKRMKPSATASVPQRPRRSALECDAAEAGRLDDELAGGEEALRRVRARQREAHDRPEARVADVAHLGALTEQRRQRPRVGHLALEPQRVGGERAVCEPRLERSRQRTGQLAPVAQLRGVAGGDVAHVEVAVAVQVLRRAHDRHVRAELEDVLMQRPGQRVVDRDERVRVARDRRDVDDVQRRVRRRLEEDGGRTGQRLANGRVVGRHEPHLDRRAARGGRARCRECPGSRRRAPPARRRASASSPAPRAPRPSPTRRRRRRRPRTPPAQPRSARTSGCRRGCSR